MKEKNNSQIEDRKMRKKAILITIALMLTLSGCSLNGGETADSKGIENKAGIESTQSGISATETPQEETMSFYENETVSEPETTITEKAETKIAKIITTVTETLKATTEKQANTSTTHKKATPKTRKSSINVTDKAPKKATTAAAGQNEPPTEGTTKQAGTAPSTTKAPAFIPSGEKSTKPTTTTTTRANPTGKKLSFSTTDINGNPVSMNTYSDYKVIIINMWEPWCGPCVGEMPDLQKLYKKYQSKGLLVIGVYSTEQDAKTTVESNGITYPIIKKSYEFNEFDTGYVPTTIIVDGQGNILTSEPIIGSRSYKEWEALVKPYLN